MTGASWVEKHRPDDWDDVQGNTSALDSIRDWIENFEPGDPPQLLIGEPGTGKTSTAYVAAEQTGHDFNEIDASTARRSSDIREFAAQMRAGDQLVLLDEVDSWHHAVNLDPLHNELTDSQNPVMMTANSEYDVPHAVKGPADVHEFKLNVASRRARIKEIAKREGVPLDEQDLERLVERPDLRSAINDLQIHSSMGLPIDPDQREWESSEFEAMDKIIQLNETEDIDIRPPWLLMWLDQNLRQEYEGLECAVAYDALSRADVHLGSTGQGDYRGWRYAGMLAELTGGLQLSEPYTGWVRWEFPSWVQSSTPKVDDDVPEAELYRELKGYGDPGFRMSGGYVEFRETVLPLLRRFNHEDKQSLVVEEGLSQRAAEALGIDADEYDDLTIYESATAGEELAPDHGDALAGDW